MAAWKAECERKETDLQRCATTAGTGQQHQRNAEHMTVTAADTRTIIEETVAIIQKWHVKLPDKVMR